MTQAARPRDRIVAESARQTLLILGAGGDLTARLLLPGLGSLLASDSGRQARPAAARQRPQALG